MKTYLLAMLLIFAMTAPLSAAPDNTRSRFYNMNGSTIDGEIMRPSHQLIQSLGTVKFQRLLRLKRNLVGDHLRQTMRYRTFK
jgi:hypothetical protein